MKIIVTGGAGFIGSAVLRSLVQKSKIQVLNIDCLTYAGNLDSLASISSLNNYAHANINICDKEKVSQLFSDFEPDAIMHLAAESHVDRSIEQPNTFIETNIIGTLNLLEVTKNYLRNFGKKFIFHHISTDEVYGDLGRDSSDLFLENSRYDPSSPYAASKASSDHLVRAWGRTFNIPYVVTNCSNNYGPFQFPEKLIPHMIISCLKKEKLNVYGDGLQIRDWLYVEDHASALIDVLMNGQIGETYNIGGHNEKTNVEVVYTICELLDELKPLQDSSLCSYRELVNFVEDRPGHDERYAIDSSKIKNTLNWTPEENFESGLRKTVIWYLENQNWLERILSGEYSINRKGLLKDHE